MDSQRKDEEIRNLPHFSDPKGDVSINSLKLLKRSRGVRRRTEANRFSPNPPHITKLENASQSNFPELRKKPCLFQDKRARGEVSVSLGIDFEDRSVSDNAPHRGKGMDTEINPHKCGGTRRAPEQDFP
jgi:hypothetical protein